MKATKGLHWVLLISVAGIALTLGIEHMSADHAARQLQAQQRHALLTLLPADSYDNQPLDQPLAVVAQRLANSQLHNGYRATLSGQTRAVLLRLVANGYGGPIELLIAIDRDGALMGIKTLAQSETPSIGGPVIDPGNPWLAAFNGRSRNDLQGAGFDHVAGATVTSRAVTDAVHDALRYFDEHRPALLEEGPHD